MRRARGETPAPKTCTEIGAERVVIEALCPEQAMAHFSFGDFRPDEADAVRTVRCPICGGCHVLVSAQEWVSGIAHGDRDRNGPRFEFKEGSWKKAPGTRMARSPTTTNRVVAIREDSRRFRPNKD